MAAARTLTPVSTGAEPRADRTYRTVVNLFRAAFAAFDLQVTVTGAEHIPAHGPAVLACNHVSYLDFALVGVAARQRGRLVRFMAKESTFTNQVSGPLMRGMHHVPVSRGGGLAGAPAYRKAIRELERGEVVGLFPESTISRSWTLRPCKPGAAALAVRQQVPLLPVVTWGGHRLATVDGHVHPARHIAVTVAVGAPLAIAPGSTHHDVQPLLEAAIQDLLDVAQSTYPVDGSGRWWQPLHLDGTAPTRGEAAEREREVAIRRGLPVES